MMLPEQLQSIEPARKFPQEHNRWFTNEEIASVLISFDKHHQWQQKDLQTRPRSGEMLLYNRKMVRYRRDGYIWKRRRDGRTAREDHMKLKVKGLECIYGCYVHSAILPTFHRRSYWLLQNPDMVLVHYLNVPSMDENGVQMPTLSHCPDRTEWTQEDLMNQLRPMFYMSESVDTGETVTDETLLCIVNSLIDNHRIKQQMESTNNFYDSERRAHDDSKCRIISPKTPNCVQKNDRRSIQKVYVSSLEKQCNVPRVSVIHGQLVQGQMQSHFVQNQSKSEIQGSNAVVYVDISPAQTTTSTNESVIFLGGTNIKNADENVEFSADAEMTCKNNLQTFSDNLELSSEEVNRTLQANMPNMQIENNPFSTLSVTSSQTENALSPFDGEQLSLDAIDNILAELPEFDCLNNLVPCQADNTSVDAMACDTNSRDISDARCNANTVNTANTIESSNQIKQECGISACLITDFSPEWGYSEGGTKVLVTGPWCSSTAVYSVMFGEAKVPATLIQEGVLRCFIPEHKPGLVSLKVAINDYFISDSRIFEFKAKEEKKQSWINTTDAELKLSLLDRVDSIKRHLSTISGSEYQVDNVSYLDQYEEKLCRMCADLIPRQWTCPDLFLTNHTPVGGMTLLHLSAALGYAVLVKTLVQWRSENPSELLSNEVNEMSVDENSSTPFMWACAYGHTSTAITLYHLDKKCINMCNRYGIFPMSLAKHNGHSDLVKEIEMLESADSAVYPPPASSYRSASVPCQTPSSGPSRRSSRGSYLSYESLSPIPSSPHSSLQSIASASEAVKTLTIDIATPTYHEFKTPQLPSSTERVIRVRKRSRLQKTFSVESGSKHLMSGTSSKAPDVLEMTSMRSANSVPHIFANTQNMPEDRTSDQDKEMDIDNDIDTSDVDTSSRSTSPYVDVERLSSDDETSLQPDDECDSGTQGNMVTLAKQIIAAMPQRIKMSPSRGDDLVPDRPIIHPIRERSSSYSSYSSAYSSGSAQPFGDDSGVGGIMVDNITFDEARYHDLSTPSPSMSPDSSCLHSPYSFTLDSPPPTTEEFTEYFNAPTWYMERDFSKLTLSDDEQRKLLQAAKIIQSAYKKFKNKRQKQQQSEQKNKEIEAAVLIQSYYRRYKQYIYYKKMTQAAVLIQSQFRSFYAQKRFKRSRNAAMVIQNQYRTYKQHERFKKSRNAAVIIQQRFRNHYQRKRQVKGDRRLAREATAMHTDVYTQDDSNQQL